MPTPRFTRRGTPPTPRPWPPSGAKSSPRRAFGDDGPGLDVDFRTFEQIATAAAQGLTEGTLQLLLEQQADKLPDEQPCPTCGKLCPTEPHTPPPDRPGSRGPAGRTHRPLSRLSPGLFPPCGLPWDWMSTPTVPPSSNASSPPPPGSPRSAMPPTLSGCRAIAISESQVRRLAHEVGQELIDERDRKAVEHRRRQLAPRTEVIPEAVVVEVDGGRIRTRAAGAGPGFTRPRTRKTRSPAWPRLSGPTFTTDPRPEPPESFLCPRRVQRLVSQMKGQAGEADPQEIRGANRPVSRPGRSGARRRSVGRRSGWFGRVWRAWRTSSSFGPLVAAEAQRAALLSRRKRRAFVADGLAYNWSIHEGYFRDFEPIVDFLHVLCYVYSSARAVSADESSWLVAVPGVDACVLAGSGRETCWRSWTGGKSVWGCRRQAKRRVGGGPSRPASGGGRGAELLEEQRRADGLPAVPSGGSADDEQSGGVAGGRVQRAGEEQAEALGPSARSGVDPATACGRVERG